MKAWLLAWILVSPAAMAQTQTVVTRLWSNGPAQTGAQYREEANRAARAALAGDHAQARRLLRPVLDYCDALATPTRDVVNVADAAEYEAYIASRGDGQPVEWVDLACPNAYKMRAFLAVEDKAYDEALSFLDRAQAIAPYRAEAYAERGYVLNQLGRHDDALRSYERGLELVERHPSNAYARALMLRGLGYTWIELKDLDRAEGFYRRSLEVEPGNATATQELEYIERSRPPAPPASQ